MLEDDHRSELSELRLQRSPIPQNNFEIELGIRSQPAQEMKQQEWRAGRQGVVRNEEYRFLTHKPKSFIARIVSTTRGFVSVLHAGLSAAPTQAPSAPGWNRGR